MIRRVVAVVWNCVEIVARPAVAAIELNIWMPVDAQPANLSHDRPGIAGKPIHIINWQTSSVASVTIFNHLSVSAFSVLKIE